MKVQIFPKIADPTVAAGLPHTPPTGALTFKPLAFQFRPWELTTLTVANHLEGQGTLTFHLRGTQVQKITSSAWLHNHTRFAYDGFRRQRLTTPLLHGRPCAWSTGLATWLSTVYSRAAIFQLDPVSATNWSPWLTLYHHLHRGGGLGLTVAVDTNVVAQVYHGSFGLPAAAAAAVALPQGLPYEGLNLLRPPTGVPTWGVPQVVPQLWRPTSGYTPGGWAAAPADGRPRVSTCALFQVSPLTRLLGVS